MAFNGNFLCTSFKVELMKGVHNFTAAIASKNLYAFATTAVNADITAGRFTVELEYSVY